MQLAEYLDSQEISDDDFAKAIGVDRQSVHRYKTFARFPRRGVLEKIIEITNGTVTANDLVKPAEDLAAPEKQGMVV